MCAMKSIFIRELQRYSKADLERKFDTANCLPWLKKLKEYGILKRVRNSSTQRDLSDLVDVEEESLLTAEDEGTVTPDDCYAFTFVGVIALDNYLLKCLPKYLSDNCQTPQKHLKQILQVIDKYDRDKEQQLHRMEAIAHTGTQSRLSVMLFLLHDYFEHGIYTDYKELVDMNGSGDILWDKSVNSLIPLISEDRPYYTQLYARRQIRDDQSFFKQLHEAILSQCSQQLKDIGLLDLFDLTEVNLTDETPQTLGDDSYLKLRLKQERKTQFNTHKQQLLTAMLAYLDYDLRHHLKDSITTFGTNAFNLVWEEACSCILNNQYEKLKKEIPHPLWKVGDCYQQDVASLKPDIIYEDADNFIIFDAKYYSVDWTTSPLTGQPGIADIIKQFFYHLAFQKYLQGKTKLHTANYFLMPTADNQIHAPATVTMALPNLAQIPIQIRLLPATEVFESYLNNTTWKVQRLMTLETHRLILRRWNNDDAEDLFHAASDPDVGPRAGWPPHRNVQESRNIINTVFTGQEAYAVCRKADSKPIGAIELKLHGQSAHLATANDECELGYWLAKDFWGQGLIPEAAAELLRHAFEDLNMNIVWCGYYEGNINSKRVQEKLGFIFHHTLHQTPVPLLNDFRDEHVTRLTREQWKTRHLP